GGGRTRQAGQPPFLCGKGKAWRRRDLAGETRGSSESELGETEGGGGGETAETVTHAAAKVYRGRLGEILRRTTDLRHDVAVPDHLCEHLVVEDEVVGIFPPRDAFQQLPREGAVARVVFGKLGAD